ncbi:unnamed protein product [Allacma fusca]|uniref:Uncharacterized protein n=2 Tax=Allacma fusca TaxID=39272 RepID=A0A8J2J0X3_9HEXA|nr:unnamed protein product [Allacma fusca]
MFGERGDWESTDDLIGPWFQMWCARYGHLECGIILAQWSPESLQKRDTNGLNPVQTAVARGFVKFASELEKIQSRATPTFPHQLHTEDFTSPMGNMSRFQRSSSSVSEDFGLKDCFFGQPDTTLELSVPSEEESRVLTLAEQIIAAMPDRIKVSWGSFKK